MAKNDILKDIVAKKKERISLAIQQLSLEDLKTKLAGLPATRPFKEVISKPRQISLIAEIKKATPAKGIIRQNFNLQEIARA
jgi:indole-3-glycerol phosphate synthase